MNTDEQIIQQFFTSFKKLDAAAMNACYSHDIAFYDPMFDLLKGDEVKAMWTMLCKNAKDFSLEFDSIKNLEDGYYTTNWKATYLFSKTGKKVVNICTAHMKIEHGLIIEHSDAWSLHKWAAQALGFMGNALGWAGFFRRRIKNDAKRSLLHFMEEQHH